MGHRHDDPFDLKVEGAYHGIFMRQLEQMASSTDAGEINAFVLEGSRLVTLTQALPRGYYVVLVVDRSGSRAQALHQLRRAAEAIAKEIV